MQVMYIGMGSSSRCMWFAARYIHILDQCSLALALAMRERKREKERDRHLPIESSSSLRQGTLDVTKYDGDRKIRLQGRGWRIVSISRGRGVGRLW